MESERPQPFAACSGDDPAVGRPLPDSNYPKKDSHFLLKASRVATKRKASNDYQECSMLRCPHCLTRLRPRPTSCRHEGSARADAGYAWASPADRAGIGGRSGFPQNRGRSELLAGHCGQQVRTSPISRQNLQLVGPIDPMRCPPRLDLGWSRRRLLQVRAPSARRG
jgi:hypothetical protein